MVTSNNAHAQSSDTVEGARGWAFLLLASYRRTIHSAIRAVQRGGAPQLFMAEQEVPVESSITSLADPQAASSPADHKCSV